jgi:hypothetical protein
MSFTIATSTCFIDLPAEVLLTTTELIDSVISRAVADVIDEKTVGTSELDDAREHLLDTFHDSADRPTDISDYLRALVSPTESGIRLHFCSEESGSYESFWLLVQRFAMTSVDRVNWIHTVVEDSKSPTENYFSAVLESGVIVDGDAIEQLIADGHPNS